ncbi:MAG: hypothetical protein QXP68_04335 [Thermosphaera sp.]
MRRLDRYLRLLYVGAILVKLHLTSYLSLIVNVIFWSILLIIPTSMFSPDFSISLKTFIPGLVAMSIASMGLWTGTEFLRWMVHDGLTDMFRENGLGVYHYIVSTLPIDVILLGIIPLLLLGVISSWFFEIDYLWILTGDMLPLLMGVLSLMIVELFYGSLSGYLYTKTRLSSSWTGLLQIMVTIGTVIPSKAYPNPYLAFVNPASLSAELLRASYGVSCIESSHLVFITLPFIFFYTYLSKLFSKWADELMAKYGVEYRF